MTYKPSSSWFERNPKKTIFCVVVITLVLVDLLAGLLFLPEITGTYHPYYHHDLKNNQKNPRTCKGRDFYVYTNSLGFKDSSRNKISLKPDRYRVLFIGDSFTEGTGYPYEKTFVGFVDRETDKGRIEILNAGVMSYSPKLYYLKTKYLLEKTKLEFNELYVFVDLTDIYDEIDYESFDPPQRAIFKQLDIFLKNRLFIYNRLRNHFFKLSYWNKFFQIVPPDQIFNSDMIGEERALWTYDEKAFQKWGKKGLLLSEQYMEKLFLLCKKYGIKMTVAVYPHPAHIKRRDLDSVQVRFWKKFTEKHGINFLNYFPDFINETDPDEVVAKYFISGDIHWNEEGHKVIAEKLIERINDMREIK